MYVGQVKDGNSAEKFERRLSCIKPQVTRILPHRSESWPRPEARLIFPWQIRKINRPTSRSARSVGYMSRPCLNYRLGARATFWTWRLLIRLRKQFTVPNPRSFDYPGKIPSLTGCRIKRRGSEVFHIF